MIGIADKFEALSGASSAVLARVMAECLREEKPDLADITAVAHVLARNGFTAAEVTELASEAAKIARGS